MEHRRFGTARDGIEKLEGLTAVRKCLTTVTIYPDLKADMRWTLISIMLTIFYEPPHDV